MNLVLTKDPLTICKFEPDEPIPAWAVRAGALVSITRTPEELSIVCGDGLAPASVKQEPNWCAFRIKGPLDFGLTGILATVLAPLAQAQISIFALSTFNTDYILVKTDKVEAATQALRTAGHDVCVE